MTVSAANRLTLPLSYLAATLAASATFQAWTGSANATEALDRIAWYFVDTSSWAPDGVGVIDELPVAVIDWKDYVLEKIAENQWEVRSATLSIVFREQVSESDAGDAGRSFGNTLGAIVEDMIAVAGLAGKLDARAFRKTEGPFRADVKEEAATYGFYQCEWAVEFASA